MIPVNQDNGYILSGYVAGAPIAYGMFVERTASGVCKGCAGASYDFLGIACDREVENESNPGFYDTGEVVAIKPCGIGMAWIMGGDATIGGSYLKAGGGAYGATTEAVGYLIDEGTPAQRALTTLAKNVGDATTGEVGSTDYAQLLVSNAAAGDLTLTLDAGKMTSLALVVGDYIVIDSDAAQEINRVKSLTTTTITLQNACAAAYTTAATGKVYKLCQVKVLIV